MEISDRGILNDGPPGGPRAVTTFPAVTQLADGTLLATYRVGSTKDDQDETIELRRSSDGGRTWGQGETPFTGQLEDTLGSIKLAYVTPLADGHLIAAAMWVDRQTHPGQPLFNSKTEGCLPMRILLADSHDQGQTWTPWRRLPVPTHVGPPSLTSPVLALPNGRLALSIETNKEYDDATPWKQQVVYFESVDQGETWSSPRTVSVDPSGRIFNWDQRAAIAPDGRLVTFTWTYDRTTTRYLNVHRRISADAGHTWSDPEDLGFADQPSRPAILADGRVVVAWVDRFRPRTIRARLAEAIDRPFLASTEVTLYKFESPQPAADTSHSTTGQLLDEMSVWYFGLPYAEPLAGGDGLVVYYGGTPAVQRANWVRLNVAG
ncbi:MAG: sialidase family protein, partial [Pirellulales bacterium]